LKDHLVCGRLELQLDPRRRVAAAADKYADIIGRGRPVSPATDADRTERRYHYEIGKQAQAATNHRAALRRWILKAAVADVPLVEIAEAAGTTVERVEDVLERERCGGSRGRQVTWSAGIRTSPPAIR
jgi:hypothetical protein